MKTVLILSKYFFPSSHVGANRVTFTSSYLHQLGWKPIVITTDTGSYDSRQSGAEKNIPLPEHYIHRIKYMSPMSSSWVVSFMGLRWDIIGKPELTAGNDLLWKKLVPTAEKMIFTHKPDVIYSTIPPPIMAYMGHYLSSKHNIPHVIDFRDVPQQFTDADIFLFRMRYRRHCKRIAKPIAAASAIITVSDGLRTSLYENYKRDSYVIYNGFDHFTHETAALKNIKDKHFTISYTGSLSFNGLKACSPEPLFHAIDILLMKYGNRELLNWKIKFIGLSRNDLKPFQHYKSFDLCEFTGRVPYAESVAYQHSSTILLHLTHRWRQGIITSKIFDYLAASRPILTIPGDNDYVDDLLNKTGAGVSLEDPEVIAEQLMNWYLQWKESGRIFLSANKEEIETYSRQNQTKKLASILESSINVESTKIPNNHFGNK
ncbi:MAG: glycosyltransferase [Desulfosalsimonas sp.]